MKKILFISVIILSSFCLISCSKNTPQNVAEKFAICMANGDVEGAKKYASKNTIILLNMASSLQSVMPEMENKSDYKFKLIKDSIVDNKAWITYITKENTEDVLELIKEDNEWKVSMGK